MADAMEQFVAQFNGDASHALLALADRYRIGVAYVDKFTVNRHITDCGGEELSDEEWDRVAPKISSSEYDDFVSEHGDSELEFIKSKLYEAGVQRDI